ncbi:Pr6Pr family membrane protein [Porifericola rhodea]|uniref:Pr6Pr family membrane protein n=1 Tax=Porifericola rhodea TaxID=930972 RepID=UPI00266615C1|nr:Pr6Pr family membrane protein [Porifericola rhodea]WKN29591.1 Pr6Pr family membrane protein [Porifericola rhodea]
MLKTEKYFNLIGAAVGTFALLSQYILMLENSNHTTLETSIRFFSYFTILTNSLVTIFFLVRALGTPAVFNKLFSQPGVMTAISVYITIVGVVYQLLLRQIWAPEGLQLLVDELLHSVIPLYFVFYWYRFEAHSRLRWQHIPSWLFYPLLYLVYVLLRGSVSGFYPYPFLDVNSLGVRQVLLNSLGLLFVFLFFSVLYVGIGRWKIQRTVYNA